MMKLQSACLCKVTFLLLWRATSGKPILVNSARRSSTSGAVYSTNSKPSVPIGLSSPRMLSMDVPNGWSREGGGKALVRSFKFKDFSEAFGFLTRVALHAEKADHQ